METIKLKLTNERKNQKIYCPSIKKKGICGWEGAPTLRLQDGEEERQEALPWCAG